MQARQATWIMLIFFGILGAAASATPPERAPRIWDLEEARSNLAATRVPGVSAEEKARALLTVAELLRLDYEALAKSAREQRRQLGEEIDALAQSGELHLAEMEESSERERLQADLLATQIRTSFRAKKYGEALKTAVERALELDPKNAEAWATSAKPYLFADAERGGDLPEARRRLGKALELEPRLESALLLRAEALRRSGDEEGAERAFREVLEIHPKSRPALEALVDQRYEDL